MPKPICFMVMPFGKRKTDGVSAALPKEIDFDALWNKAFFPVLAREYQPVRADQDLGALIIKEMIERLVIADLVVADVTLPNANVYYEVGIRHAARENRCVLIAADGSRQLFDIAQMPQLRYPLKSGNVTAPVVRQIKKVLERDLGAFATGESPVHQSLPGYPEKVNPAAASSFKEYARDMMEFQSKTRAVHVAGPKSRRKKALAVLSEYGPLAGNNVGIALELLYLARDCAGWAEMLAFVDGLKGDVRHHPTVEEQYWLAQSAIGNHETAIGALLALCAQQGDTSERHGLLGGRYRRMYKESSSPKEKQRFLDKAIEHYRRGMELDLNNYYPSGNLPRLYRTRGKPGDADLARTAAAVTLVACERARKRDPDDEWLRPTLLGAAFDAGNVEEAKKLLAEMETEGTAKWKLKTTLETLEISAKAEGDERKRRALRRIIKRMRELLDD